LLDQWGTTLLSHSQPSSNAAPAITSLINHANDLSLTIIQTSQSVSTLSIVLRFYESTASLISYPELKSVIRITIPPAELIYTLYFTLSLPILSRLCGMLALYKRAFEIAMASPSTLDQESYPKDYVNRFNGFLMDICNCAWRARALNTSDPNALGCLLPAPVTSSLTNYVSSLDRSLSLPSLFGVSFCPVFCLLAISYVRELEDQAEDIERRHAGPVTQNSLKQLEKGGGLSLSFQDYKLGVLQYMENKGAPGVGELMYNTMKHLMDARQKRS
jgi:centromere protein I